MSLCLHTVFFILLSLTRCPNHHRTYVTNRRNWALLRPTTSSVAYKNHRSHLAVDGDVTSVEYHNTICFRADPAENTPWWAVEFESEVYVTEVVVIGSADLIGVNLGNARIELLSHREVAGVCATQTTPLPPGLAKSYFCPMIWVVTSLRISQTPLPDETLHFHLCEVQVFGWKHSSVKSRQDWARGMPTKQSSTKNFFTSQKAVDGSDECAQTRSGDRYPWWLVNLKQLVYVTAVVIDNRAHCCGERLHNFTVEGLQSEDDRNPVKCADRIEPVETGATVVIRCEQHLPAYIIRVRKYGPLTSSTDILILCRVAVNGHKIVDIDRTYRFQRDNQAQDKNVLYSSFKLGYGPGLAVDGVRNNEMDAFSCFISDVGDEVPFLKVDLTREYYVEAVVVTNPLNLYSYKMHDVIVRVDSRLCCEHRSMANPGSVVSMICENRFVYGRHVLIMKRKNLEPVQNILALCEVEIYGNDDKRNWMLTVPFDRKRNGPNFFSVKNPSWLAIDGNVSVNMDPVSCSLHLDLDKPAEWFAILDMDIYVTKAVIMTPFFRDQLFLPFTFYVDDYSVHHEGDVPCGTPITLTTEPMTFGKHVKIARDFRFTYLFLCEVQVYGGPRYTRFGRD